MASARISRFFGRCKDVFSVEAEDFYSIDMDQLRHQPLAGNCDVAFGDERTLQEMLELQDLGITQRDEQYYQQLLSAHAWLVVARVEGEIAAFVWVSSKNARFYNRVFTMRSDELYLHRGLTRPSFRGKDIMPDVIRFSCRELSTLGFRVCYGAVATHNIASIRAVKKMAGTKTNSHVRRFRILGRDHLSVSGSLKKRFRPNSHHSVEPCDRSSETQSSNPAAR